MLCCIDGDNVLYISHSDTVCYVCMLLMYDDDFRSFANATKPSGSPPIYFR